MKQTIILILSLVLIVIVCKKIVSRPRCAVPTQISLGGVVSTVQKVADTAAEAAKKAAEELNNKKNEMIYIGDVLKDKVLCVNIKTYFTNDSIQKATKLLNNVRKVEIPVDFVPIIMPTDFMSGVNKFYNAYPSGYPFINGVINIKDKFSDMLNRFFYKVTFENNNFKVYMETPVGIEQGFSIVYVNKKNIKDLCGVSLS